MNAVVNDDNTAFDVAVKTYLVACVGAGLTGGIQSLCFNVVGQ